MNTETKTLATATERQTNKQNQQQKKHNRINLKKKKKSLGLNIMHGLNIWELAKDKQKGFISPKSENKTQDNRKIILKSKLQSLNE